MPYKVCLAHEQCRGNHGGRKHLRKVSKSSTQPRVFEKKMSQNKERLGKKAHADDDMHF